MKRFFSSLLAPVLSLAFGHVPSTGVSPRWIGVRALVDFVAFPSIGWALLAASVFVSPSYLVPLAAFTLFNVIRGLYCVSRIVRHYLKLGRDLIDRFKPLTVIAPEVNIPTPHPFGPGMAGKEAKQRHERLKAAVERARPENVIAQLRTASDVSEESRRRLEEVLLHRGF